MRYYNPYADLATMKGLGFSIDPRKIPNPKSSKASAEEWLLLWGEWAADREKVLRSWAVTLDELVKFKSATCADLNAYNKAALTHWAKEVVMSLKLIEAGATPKQVPQPPLPAIFAKEVRVIERGPGAFSIQHSLPCSSTSKFPNFDQLKMFGKKEVVAGAFTPQAGEAQLGLFLAAAAPWAAEVFTTVVVAAIAGAVVAFSVDRLVDGFTGAEIARIDADMKKGSEEAGLARSKFALDCLEQATKAAGGSLTIEQIATVREQCNNEALRLNPPVAIPDKPLSFGTSILVGGLGIAIVVGSIAYLRRK